MSRKHSAWVALSVLLLDQITKAIVAANLPLHGSVMVIQGFFRITHEQNQGAAFSLFANWHSHYRTGLLAGLSILAVGTITLLLWKQVPARHGPRRLGSTLALSLILGGAMGNLTDRLLAGRVTDFLEFYLGSHIWPDFNVADSAIVTGALLLLAGIIFQDTRARS